MKPMSRELKAMLIDAAIRFESKRIASLQSKSTSPSENKAFRVSFRHPKL